MPLSKGDRLGPYEILALVGKGGMGEVYRAHDERLSRDIAIKVSSAEFTERFTREARAIASLNHTNVCHLYDVGPNYLVMEFVEGDDLKGPLDFDAALPIIRQLIDGIEAAHEKNIVHRDLKPANIKITHDGVVKILDFGLAKASDLSPSGGSTSGDPRQSPTLTIGATVAGTILGTAAYMSPEQAKGKQVDKRSDIFSFGVVVYELLTGMNPFGGETVVESLGAVLNKNPDWAPIPARAERLLSWCLEKDRKRRLASISDARRILDEPVSQAPAAEPVTVVQIQKEPASKIAWLAAGVLGVALAAWSFLARPDPAARSGIEAVRFTLAPPAGAIFTANRAGGAQLAVSPDGRYVAFVADPVGSGAGGAANRVLWVRALGSLAAQRLDKTDGATSPFWSPDSKNIGFFAEGKLKRIAVSGGSPINLCDVENDEGGTWFQQESADGKSDGMILFTPSGTSAIQRVPATGGVPTPVTKLTDGEITHRYPQFLPDGKRFLYHARSRSGKTGIYVQQLGSDQRTFLMETAGRARFSPPDFLLYMRDNTLLAQHFDWATLKPLGEPASVTDEVRGGGGLANARNAFSASDTGILAYRAGASGIYSFRWYTRDGKEEGPALGGDGDNGVIELSPDNKRAVFGRRVGGTSDLWLMELPSGVISRLTSDGSDLGDFVWGPDSRRIAFVKNNPKVGKAGIYQMVIGTGKDTLVYPDALNLEAWIRDGLVVRTGGTVSLLPAPEENATQPIAEKPRVLLDVKYSVDLFSVSPDGKWIAYRSSESGEPEVWVATFPAFTGRRKVSGGGIATAPLWRADGKELFFAGSTNNILSVEVNSGVTFETIPPKQLVSPPSASINSSTVHLYAVSKDGKRFLIRETPNAGAAEVEPLYLILNWSALLGK